MLAPLSRCRNLAEEAGERLGIPVRVDDDLVELDFGELEGTRFEASNSGPAQFPWPLDEHGHSLPAPGAESFEHATARANHLMDELEAARRQNRPCHPRGLLSHSHRRHVRCTV